MIKSRLRQLNRNSTTSRLAIIALAKKHFPRLVYRDDARRTEDANPDVASHVPKRFVSEVLQPLDSKQL
jgi:hypothetical protein